MSTDLTEVQIESYGNILLERVPEDGSSIGNMSLQNILRWDDDLYWTIRNALIGKGILIRGRGRGGSVKRVVEKPKIQDKEDALIEAAENVQKLVEYDVEQNLYEPAHNVILHKWMGNQEYTSRFSLVQTTANQGSRQTGGQWSRPDIVAVAYVTYPFVPGFYLDVISFEVKTYKNLNLDGLYEALAHLRFVTHAYVLAHIPDEHKAENEDVIGEIVNQGKSFGIGVIVAEDINRYETWDTLVEAERQIPDPARLNDFIRYQLNDENKEVIQAWIKR
ncbi:MAG: hypothetical protein ACPG7F_04525 [Aggregatilineales bacterium]